MPSVDVGPIYFETAKLVIVSFLVAGSFQHGEEPQRHTNYLAIGQFNHDMRIGKADGLRFVARVMDDWFEMQVTVFCHL